MTPPVQRNFYAVGHKYKRNDGEAMKYLGSVTLSDGNIDHIWWQEGTMSTGKLFALVDSYDDASCTHFFPLEVEK